LVKCHQEVAADPPLSSRPGACAYHLRSASRLETVLLPALIDPTFAHPILFAPVPPSTIRSTVSAAGVGGGGAGGASPFNPCQTFCLSLAHAAFEVRHAFGEKLAGAGAGSETAKAAAAGAGAGAAFPKFVADALKPVVEKLDSIVGRVILPLLAILKRELAAALAPLAEPDKAFLYGSGSGSGGSNGSSKPKLGHGGGEPSPAACLAVFAAKVDHARRALAKIAGGCGEAGEGWVVGIAVATIWRGMVHLVERRPGHGDRFSSSSSRSSPRLGAARPPQPAAAAAGAPGRSTPDGSGAAGGLAAASAAGRPPLAAKASASVATLLRAQHLPPSRPSSPPRAAGGGGGGGGPAAAAAAASEPAPAAVLGALEAHVRRLVDGLVPYVLPAEPDPGHLAREALAEAIEALQSLRIVVGAIGRPNGLATVLVGLRELKRAAMMADGDDDDDDGDDDDDHQAAAAAAPEATSEQFLDALDDVPPVLLLHLFSRRLEAAGRLSEQDGGHPKPPPPPPATTTAAVVGLRPPHVLFGWSKDQYDGQVLAGFGAAEEWETKVGAAVKAEVGRVLPDAQGDDERKWLEALALVVDVI